MARGRNPFPPAGGRAGLGPVRRQAACGWPGLGCSCWWGAQLHSTPRRAYRAAIDEGIHVCIHPSPLRPPTCQKAKWCDDMCHALHSAGSCLGSHSRRAQGGERGSSCLVSCVVPHRKHTVAVEGVGATWRPTGKPVRQRCIACMHKKEKAGLFDAWGFLAASSLYTKGITILHSTYRYYNTCLCACRAVCMHVHVLRREAGKRERAKCRVWVWVCRE